MNKVILIGRLTKDPETRYTQSGLQVTTFTLAVDRRFAKKDSNQPKADFIPIVAWGKTAEFVNQWFGKGDLITIVGRIEVRNYEDKNGNKRTATEIIAEEVLFGGSKSTDKGSENASQRNLAGLEEVDDDGADLPF